MTSRFFGLSLRSTLLEANLWSLERGDKVSGLSWHDYLPTADDWAAYLVRQYRTALALLLWLACSTSVLGGLLLDAVFEVLYKENHVGFQWKKPMAGMAPSGFCSGPSTSLANTGAR